MDRTCVIAKFARLLSESLENTVDTDRAGCIRTRKSTSVGLTMYGSHCFKKCSVNLKVSTLSSGEAEYYGMIKGVSMTLRLIAILREVGVRASIRLPTDSEKNYIRKIRCENSFSDNL